MLVALFGVGFLCHTSYDPVVFGKYNLRYFTFLLIWYLVFVPGTFFFVRFLLTVHEIRLASGRTIAVRPRLKLTLTLIAALVGYIARGYAGPAATGLAAGHPRLERLPSLPAKRPAPQATRQLHTNRWGFRGEEIEKTKPAGAFRIFFFGGSTVICEEVPFEDSHCRVLEKRLRAAYPNVKIEVQNLGAEWHTSAHSVMKLLFQAQEFSPDLVIICHGINDLVRSFEADAFTEGPYQNDYGHYYGPIIGMVRPRDAAAVLVRTAGGLLVLRFPLPAGAVARPRGQRAQRNADHVLPRAEPVTVNEWPSLMAFERNLRDFVQIAQSKKYRVMMATQPSIYRDDLSDAEKHGLLFSIVHQFQGKMASIASMKRGMEQFNAKARQIAAELQVPLVDLERIVPKSLDYMYDDVHYTKRGNETIGRAVAEQIIKWGVIGGK